MARERVTRRQKDVSRLLREKRQSYKDKLKTLKNPANIRAAALLLFLPFLFSAASLPPEKTQSAKVLDFQDSNWDLYQNEQQGYSLQLPPQLKVSFTKQNYLEWSAENRMPFDYVNFRPKEESDDLEPFELGVGIHWNRDDIGTREFADKKDEGLQISGAEINIIRQTEATVSGIRGVRDDFRLRQPYGWRSYSRIIIPFKDKFFVFLGTLGSDKPVPEYERIYDKIVGSFVFNPGM